MTTNVYEQYFGAHCTFNGVERHGALVMLISDSDHGTIRYEAAVSFFPHNDPTDFAVSYDAYLSKVIYEAAGRRSKKKEAVFMKDLRATIDELAASIGGFVNWELPLRDARLG
jgi:hypothetical protein